MALQIPIISEFDGKGVRKAIAEFKQLEGAGKKTQFALRKAAVPAAAALGGLAVAAVDAAKAALQDQQAQAVLARTLKLSTKATDDQIAATEEFIAKQGQLFGITDDDLRPAIGTLARATKDLTRAQRLATVAQDIAGTTGKDLQSISVALAKAEMGQFTALRRLGVPIGKNTQAQIEQAKAIKKVEAAQNKLNAVRQAGDRKDILRATETLTRAQRELNAVTEPGADFIRDLEAAFGGGAAAAAETTAGKMKRLAVALNEAKEAVGEVFLPVLEALLPKLQTFAIFAQKNPDLIVKLAGAFAALTVAVLALNVAMSLNPVSLVVIGLAALSAVVVAAYTRFETFRNIVDGVFSGIAFVIQNVTIPIFNALLATAKTVFNTIALIFNNTLGRLSFTIPDIPGVPGRGKSFNVPNIPLIGDGEPTARGGMVKMMAAGGIVTGPTLAMIGEAGPEAVIPLNRGGAMGNVTINVHGGDPNAVVEALRRYYRQSGPLPVAVQY